MSFTTTDVVERAAGHLSIRSEGRPISAFEGETLLSYLNDIFARVNAFTGGVDYRDIEVISDYSLRRQDRAIVSAPGSVRIELPPHPTDGMKVNIVDVGTGFGSSPVLVHRNDRLINGEARDSWLNVDGANVVYAYREDSSSWHMLNTVMTLGVEVPLPREFLGHLGAWVACEAWIEFRGGQGPSAWLETRGYEGENCLRARFAPNMTAQLDPFWHYDLSDTFNGGYVNDLFNTGSSGVSSGAPVALDPNGVLPGDDTGAGSGGVDDDPHVPKPVAQLTVV